MLDFQSLADFLGKARLAGYAAEGDFDESAGRAQREYVSTQALWAYSDLCLAEGGNGNVIGRELVHYDQELIWGMTYYGVVVDVRADRTALYTFIRQAMRTVSPTNLPARGQQNFVNGLHRYSYDLQGTLLEFSGVERVFYDSAPIYRLHFNGGLMKSRL